MNLVMMGGLNFWLDTTQNVNTLAQMSRCMRNAKSVHISQSKRLAYKRG